MAYVPPKRQKPIKQLVIIIVIGLCMGLLAWGYFQNQGDHEKEPESFTICGFDAEKTNALLDRVDGEPYIIRDYMFYGESLNLFAQPYVLGEQDDVRRKSIELQNLCNGETTTYTMETSADRQIDLGELAPGFYALNIHDGQTSKRLVYETTLTSDVFTTIRRDGKVKNVTLLANQSLKEPALLQNILFIQVEEASANDDVVDVFIDPYGNRVINGIYQSQGSGNGLQEAVEMQKAAELLKQELESYGLRVELAKVDAQEALGYYGADGIMNKAYASHAKYYIELGMNAATQSAYAGTEIYYSNYASATMANTIMYALKKNTSLSPSNAYQWSEHSEGVASSVLVMGKDGKNLYDAMVSLRESGGRITGAAQFSDAAAENAEIVQDTYHAMHALSINFIYLTNEKDALIWKKEREIIVKTMADAFVKAIHVSE